MPEWLTAEQAELILLEMLDHSEQEYQKSQVRQALVNAGLSRKQGQRVLRFKAEDLIDMQYSVEIEHIHKVLENSSGEERVKIDREPCVSREAIISMDHEKPKKGM